MKQRIQLLLGIVSLVALFTSCQKEITKKDDVPSAILPGQGTNCNIESLSIEPNTAGVHNHLIAYDEYQNPKFISSSDPTNIPVRTFKYDSWYRLREFRGEFPNGNFDSWHFYGYDNNGRLAIDTTYYSGKITGDRPTTYSKAIISQSFYDAQGRVAHVINQDMRFGFVTEEFYSYDANGNRVYPPGSGVVYDNKINLNRTNDLWQFLSKDYSMNNPFIANAYNVAGYPTVINSEMQYDWLRSGYYVNHSIIGYSCHEAYY